MNIEEIDKWLDNEYGVSYTRLEELHDFLIEQNMKYQDKIADLEQENKQLKELTDKYEEEHKTTFETWLKEINILNELEEWLNLEITIHNEDDTIDTLYSCVLDKIQELKKKYK